VPSRADLDDVFVQGVDELVRDGTVVLGEHVHCMSASVRSSLLKAWSEGQWIASDTSQPWWVYSKQFIHSHLGLVAVCEARIRFVAVDSRVLAWKQCTICLVPARRGRNKLAEVDLVTCRPGEGGNGVEGLLPRQPWPLG